MVLENGSNSQREGEEMKKFQVFADATVEGKNLGDAYRKLGKYFLSAGNPDKAAHQYENVISEGEVWVKEQKNDGVVWWVSFSSGKDEAGMGLSPETPFKTMEYALSVAKENDFIRCVPRGLPSCRSSKR